MRTLDRVVLESSVFSGMDDLYAEQLAGCSRTVGFEAGETLFREGEPADVFYVAPARPRRARAVRPRPRPADHRDDRGRLGRRLVVAVRAARVALRRESSGARAGGRRRRRLHQRQVRRRSGPRLRADAALLRGAPRTPQRDAVAARRSLRRQRWPLSLTPSRRARWCRSRTWSGVEPARRRTRGRSSSSLRRRADRAGAGAVRDAHGVRRRRGADLHQRTRRRRLARAHGPRRRRGHGRALSRAARRNDRGARAVRDDLAARGRDRARTSSCSRAGSGSRRSDPQSRALLADRESYGRLLLLYGARTPGDLLYPEQLEDVARRRGSTST